MNNFKQSSFKLTIVNSKFKVLNKVSQDNVNSVLFKDANNTKYICDYTGSFIIENVDGIVCFIYGSIIDKECFDPPNIVKNYLSLGIVEFCNKLNGSFTIGIIDLNKSKSIIITDRLNSKRVFFHHGKTKIIYGTKIKDIAADIETTINEAAIVSIIANGVPFNNLTPYNEIKVLEKSSYSIITGNDFYNKKYWNYKFSVKRSEKSFEALSEELETLLIKSIEKRLSIDSNVLVSLSGGYDTTSIISILNRILNIKDIKSFSYIYGEAISHSDAYVASKMAEINNSEHEIFQSFDNDIVASIKANAYYGQGISNYCDEISSYKNQEHFFKYNEKNIMFVGDTYFLPKVAAYSVKDILNSIGIFPSNILSSYKDLFKNANSYFDKWDIEYQRIIDQIPQYKHLSDTKDILYFNHRLSFTLMPWRDLIQSSFVNVSNPYLDNSIIDFFTEVSPDQRANDRVLYKKTLDRMFPDVFNEPRAKFNNVKPNWTYWLNIQKDDIKNKLLSTPSNLDEFVSVQRIQVLLDDVSSREINFKKFIGDIGRAIQHRSPIMNKFLNKFNLLPQKVLPKELVLRRILVLREFLKNINEE